MTNKRQATAKANAGILRFAQNDKQSARLQNDKQSARLQNDKQSARLQNDKQSARLQNDRQNPRLQDDGKTQAKAVLDSIGHFPRAATPESLGRGF